MSKYIIEVSYKDTTSYVTFNATQVVLVASIEEARAWSQWGHADIIRKEAKEILDRHFADKGCTLKVRRK